MTEEQEKSGFKVNDHRRFDDDGNPKEDAPVKESSDKEPQEDAEDASGFTMEEASETGEVDINFASFIASLATQALMQMGEIPPPEGIDMPVDPKIAKQTIDIITMLEDKTKGNLDQEEAYFLEEMLHNLRIAYLKHT